MKVAVVRPRRFGHRLAYSARSPVLEPVKRCFAVVCYLLRVS